MIKKLLLITLAVGGLCAPSAWGSQMDPEVQKLKLNEQALAAQIGTLWPLIEQTRKDLDQLSQQQQRTEESVNKAKEANVPSAANLRSAYDQRAEEVNQIQSDANNQNEEYMRIAQSHGGIADFLENQQYKFKNMEQADADLFNLNEDVQNTIAMANRTIQQIRDLTHQLAEIKASADQLTSAEDAEMFPYVSSTTSPATTGRGKTTAPTRALPKGPQTEWQKPTTRSSSQAQTTRSARQSKPMQAETAGQGEIMIEITDESPKGPKPLPASPEGRKATPTLADLEEEEFEFPSLPELPKIATQKKPMPTQPAPQAPEEAIQTPAAPAIMVPTQKLTSKEQLTLKKGNAGEKLTTQEKGIYERLQGAQPATAPSQPTPVPLATPAAPMATPAIMTPNRKLTPKEQGILEKRNAGEKLTTQEKGIYERLQGAQPAAAPSQPTPVPLATPTPAPAPMATPAIMAPNRKLTPKEQGILDKDKARKPLTPQEKAILAGLQKELGQQQPTAIPVPEEEIMPAPAPMATPAIMTPNRKLTSKEQGIFDKAKAGKQLTTQEKGIWNNLVTTGAVQ